MKSIYIFLALLLIPFIKSYSQWEPVNSGLENLFDPFLRIKNIIENKVNIYAISDDAGFILNSKDYGLTWEIINLRSDHWPHWCTNCLMSKHDTVYIGNVIQAPSQFDLIYSSNNNFQTWDIIKFPLYISLSNIEIKDNNIYIGTTEYGWIAKSPDLGKNWYVKDDKLNPYNYAWTDIIDIHVYGNRILVSLNNNEHPEYNGIYYSDDEMESFSPSVINGTNRNSIRFTDHDGILYALADNESYKSIDSGKTFISINNSFGGFTPNTLQFAFKDSIIVAGGFKEALIIISTDNGKTWRKKDQGLVIQPNCLTIIEDYIFAGTAYGIYRAKLSVLTDIEDNKPITNKIEVSPNPFSQTTTIKYSLPNSGKVKLVVYNVLGYEVAVLVDWYMDSGGHEAVFDGSGLASGAYFYVLQAGGDVQTGKLILVQK